MRYVCDWDRDDLGVRNFTRDSLHDLRSATKSVVGALVGVAIMDGAIPGVDSSLVDLFPHRAIPDEDRKRAILLRHLLTMTVGLEWDETITYADSRNSEIQMIESGDPVSYVLARDLVTPPGQVFNYCSGSTELLAAAVTNATGLSIEEFAKKRLFEPLGIDQFEWRRHSNGIPSAASGLRLRPYDLAKIAALYQSGGRWQTRQILPEAWVRDSLGTHIVCHRAFGSGADVGFGYGYQWWNPTYRSSGRPLAAGMAWGNGGQCAFIFPELALIVVLTAGNYNRFEPDNLLLPHRLVANYVLPAAGMHDTAVAVDIAG